jgi:hypothetical protein
MVTGRSTCCRDLVVGFGRRRCRLYRLGFTYHSRQLQDGFPRLRLRQAISQAFVVMAYVETELVELLLPIRKQHIPTYVLLQHYVHLQALRCENTVQN